MTEHKLAPFTIFANVTPIRPELTARAMAVEVSALLRQLTSAEAVTHGHVADRRWDLQDPASQAGLGAFPCAAHLTVVEAADLLDVTPATVRRWIGTGRLDALRQVDRSWAVPKFGVDQLLGDQEGE